MKNVKLGRGLVVWGAGVMTQRVWPDIGADNILAIIDGNSSKVGTCYLDKPVISLTDYRNDYLGRFILVTPYAEDEIEEQLLKDGIQLFFRLSDCPSEFSRPERSDILRKRLLSEMRETSNGAIYGRSLYAIMLSLWYMAETGKNMEIYLPRSVSDDYMTNLQREFPAAKFHPFVELSKGIEAGLDTLFVTDEWDIPQLKQKFGGRLSLVNAFDITDREVSYWNPCLKEFKDIHKGESCFVVGLGPSLSPDDLTRIHQSGIKSISMNSISLIFDRTPWRPTYYAAGDLAAFDDPGTERLDEIASGAAFIADVLSDFHESNKSKRVFKFHSERNMNRREEARFSEDITHVIRFGATISYVCIQIAVYMGFSRIYLIGVDSYDPAKRNQKVEHFYKEDTLTAIGFVQHSERAYMRARQYADSHDIKIYNATRGGFLEVFERVDFDDLFGICGFMGERGIR